MSTAYDDYYDAAKKDGEAVIQGEHGGCILRDAALVAKVDAQMADQHTRAAAKASGRRFDGARITAMGDLDGETQDDKWFAFERSDDLREAQIERDDRAERGY